MEECHISFVFVFVDHLCRLNRKAYALTYVLYLRFISSVIWGLQLWLDFKLIVVYKIQLRTSSVSFCTLIHSEKKYFFIVCLRWKSQRNSEYLNLQGGTDTTEEEWAPALVGNMQFHFRPLWSFIMNMNNFMNSYEAMLAFMKLQFNLFCYFCNYQMEDLMIYPILSI